MNLTRFIDKNELHLLEIEEVTINNVCQVNIVALISEAWPLSCFYTPKRRVFVYDGYVWFEKKHGYDYYVSPEIVFKLNTIALRALLRSMKK